MLIESRFIVSFLFISTVLLFLTWIAALVGKSEAFEKHVNWWRQQRLLKRAAVLAVLIGVIAYAGTKPDPSGGDDTGVSSTNDVTQVEGNASNTNDVGWIGGDADGTNDVDQVGGDTNSVGGAMLNAPRPMFGGAPSLGGRGSVLGTPVAGAAGFSLVTVGHDETFDFTPPETAVVATNWLLHGASTQPHRLSFDDWVFPYGGEGYSNFTVFAYGEVMPGEVNTNHFLVPFGASLGIVPVANWHLLSTNSNPNNLTIEQSNNSLFWSGFSPSNTLLLTWQNALLDRAATNPVSFQAELKPSGGFVFRYDLSRLVSDEPLSNAVIMAQSEDAGFADAPTTNLTSLAFHTHDEQLCDENREDFDEKIGDENPYAYPEGSTNTVLEHVFYSGTTNGTFAYPQSTDGNAVLMVSVSGSGSGELLVGSSFVPLCGNEREVKNEELRVKSVMTKGAKTLNSSLYTLNLSV
ncbi:MAG: hypothetical protein KBT68_00155, partial [bacterium]|nr:hypothetical protein [Candidatus Colisoma equi]